MYKKLLLLAAITGCMQAQALDQVYRCGNEYTNDPARARERPCQLLEGGNVTVVQGTRPASRPAAARPASAPRAATAAGTPGSSAAEQRARESDARLILEAELRKAQARKAELQREYHHGEPAKQVTELANLGLYQQRVAGMQAEIARVDSDIAGIQRELSRLPQPAD